MRERRDETIYSEPGLSTKVLYTAVQLPDGTFNLVEGESVDLQEQINSYEESCSIEHIIARCQAGDVTALNKVQGSYMDTTQFPSTFRDVLDLVSAGRAEFDHLPLEIRQKFDHDFMSWFASAGTDDWYSKMGYDKPAEENNG